MSIVRITPPRLRTMEHEERRATWLELFYDLAYVVAVAVLADRLLHDMAGVAAFLGYFGLLWWLWASHTYYADRYDTDDLVYRLLAAGQMVSVVAIAGSLSGTTESTVAFAWGYALARWVLVLMYWRAYRHVEETRDLVRGYLIGFSLAATIWTMSALVGEEFRVVGWVVALCIDLATPWIMRREQARVPLDVSHLPERFGLFTILVLGEAIAALVAGLAHAGWSIPSAATAAMGIGIATSVWWMYFDNASGTVVRRSAAVQRTWRPTAWIYTHFLLAAALAALGVGLEVAVAEVGGEPLPAAARWLLVGALAVAFASMALIQVAAVAGEGGPKSLTVSFNRLAGVPVLLGIGLLPGLEPQWLTLAVFVVCVAQVVADWRARETPIAPGMNVSLLDQRGDEGDQTSR
ncbi:MAG: low temperature requirement protein A [Acidimicrobiia bacterium]